MLILPGGPLPWITMVWSWFFKKPGYKKGILFTVGNVDREISVDIAVDIAVDTRSIVGRHSVDTWSTLG